MNKSKLKAIIGAVGIAVMTSTAALAPCVYAVGENEISQTISAEDIPEAETENGPTEDEVTNENARSAENEADAATDEDDATDEAESSGQSGETLYDTSVMNSEDAVVVTFNMDVPSDVTDPCIVTFSESDSYQEYYVEAYKTAGYTAVARIEPGTYIITGGGPTTDNIGAYDVMEKGYFTVSTDGTGDKVVNVVIRSKGDVLLGNTEPSEGFGETAETTDTATEADTSAQTNHTLLYIVIAIICAIIGAVAGIFGVKWLQKQELH